MSKKTKKKNESEESQQIEEILEEKTEELQAKEDEQSKQIVIINNIQPPAQEDHGLRAINLYGDVTEEKGQEIVSALLYLESTSPVVISEVEEETTIVNRPIKLFVSTHGGNVSDMFSIVDVMEMVKENTCDIETVGVGKVMSAGVPILAAGTKGKRKIGKNCRVMLHGVASGIGGSIFRLENELEEIRWIQDKYIECLSANTKLSKSKIKKMIKSQKDVYISAQDAVKYGIVDEII